MKENLLYILIGVLLCVLTNIGVEKYVNFVEEKESEIFSELEIKINQVDAMINKVQSIDRPERRMKIHAAPEGWLVIFGDSLTYVPDPNHSWSLAKS